MYYLLSLHHCPMPFFFSRMLNLTCVDRLAEFCADRAAEGCVSWLPVRLECEDGLLSLLPGEYWGRYLQVVVISLLDLVLHFFKSIVWPSTHPSFFSYKLCFLIITRPPPRQWLLFTFKLIWSYLHYVQLGSLFDSWPPLPRFAMLQVTTFIPNPRTTSVTLTRNSWTSSRARSENPRFFLLLLPLPPPPLVSIELSSRLYAWKFNGTN